MSDRPSLLIDVGNTQLKYTWFKHSQTFDNLQNTIIARELLATLLHDKPKVFICSVKSEKITGAIIEQLKQAGVQYCLAETKATEFGIKNSYQTLTNMGSDRWMAMLGADAIADNDIVVIDAGTAITCDFIVNKQHLGGWIAPGLEMLRRAVVSNTHRVFDFKDIIPQLSPGQDTANCVANGAIAQIVGMIMQAITLMQKQSMRFNVVITGGDRDIIAQKLQENAVDIVMHKNLVLVGLARLSMKKMAK